MSSRQSGQRLARIVVGLLVAAAFVALVVYRSLHSAGYRCDVCITFHGRQACRTVEGPSESDARASAVNNACAVLAAGITDTLACERTVPDFARCEPTQ